MYICVCMPHVCRYPQGQKRHQIPKCGLTVMSSLTLVLGNELGSLKEQQELLLLSHLPGL